MQIENIIISWPFKELFFSLYVISLLMINERGFIYVISEFYRVFSR